MALTIGIVGLPNAGKSTLFNALTRNSVLAASYPFATIDPNIGVVGVPDPRLAVLAELFHSDRSVPATVSFVDIAGIVRGASKGEGMGNAFLSHIREADAICQVTRVFDDPDVTHVDGAVNPASDIETIDTELILADLQTIEKVLPRLEKEAKINKDKSAALAAVRQAQEVLDGGRTIFAAGLDRAPLRDLFLLTAKPFLYVFNCDSDELMNEPLEQRLAALVAPAEAIFLDAKIESELVEMEPEESREFLAEMGVTEPGLDVLARVGFDTLGLQTFLTAGPKESRAWTIRKGATAPEAAGVIHSDFQKGFIRAEVVSFEELVTAGSMQQARGRGKVRLEGKDYVMADGDVVEFRFAPTSGRLRAATREVVANVLLPTAEKRVPVEILLHIAAGEMSGQPKVGAGLGAGVEQRQALWCECAIVMISTRARRVSVFNRELVRSVVLCQKAAGDTKAQRCRHGRRVAPSGQRLSHIQDRQHVGKRLDRFPLHVRQEKPNKIIAGCVDHDCWCHTFETPDRRE